VVFGSYFFRILFSFYNIYVFDYLLLLSKVSYNTSIENDRTVFLAQVTFISSSMWPTIIHFVFSSELSLIALLFMNFVIGGGCAGAEMLPLV
jgi:hypothetical protein